MALIHDILTFNASFVDKGEYEPYRTSRFPDKKIVILTCMDTRLVDLLQKSMNLKNGEAIIIRNGGAIVIQPFGNIMRSIVVSFYELGADEIAVIGHHDCGMTALKASTVVEKMKKRGIDENVLETLVHSGIDLNRWLIGFDSVKESVEKSVGIIKNHPLLPKNVPVHGLTIHPETGALELVVDGYAQSGAQKG